MTPRQTVHVDDTSDITDPTRARLRARLNEPTHIRGPIALFALGTTLALLAPGPVVVTTAIAALLFLVQAQGRRALRGPLMLLLSVTIATLAFHPLLLWLGSGTPWRSGLIIAAAAAGRLGTVLLVAAALNAWVPPAAWLQGLRRWPRVALVVMLTMRLIPEYAAMQRRVRLAQRARGLDRLQDQVEGLATAFTLVLEQAERMARSL